MAMVCRLTSNAVEQRETAAASVEGKLMGLTQVLHVLVRKLTSCVQADLVQHPSEINEASNFVVAAAQAWNVCHE